MSRGLTKQFRREHGRDAALAVVATGLAGFLIVYSIIVSKSNRLADEHIAEANRRFERVAPISQAETAALRTYRNGEHLAMAQTLGISEIYDDDVLDDLVQRGELEEIGNNPFYVVRDMDHSAPFVTPSTKNLLELIGIRFQQALASQGLPPYKFVISSATRTEANQKELRGINGNAAEKSSHEYGTTVDILYDVFVYAVEQDTFPEGFWISTRRMERQVDEALSNVTETKQAVLKAVLGRVLRQLQREDYLLVIYERMQPVYHITLARDLSDPSPNGVPLRPERPVPVGPRAVATPP